MKILINGGGNIGTTIANLMIKFKDLLGISHVYLHKNLPQEWTVFAGARLRRVFSKHQNLAAL